MDCRWNYMNKESGMHRSKYKHGAVQGSRLRKSIKNCYRMRLSFNSRNTIGKTVDNNRDTLLIKIDRRYFLYE